IPVSTPRFLPIPVATSADVMSFAGIQPLDGSLNSIPMQNYIYRWFYSAEDMHFEKTNPAIPVNPARLGSPSPTSFANVFFDNAGTIETNTVTAWRTYVYSWALMVQREIPGVVKAPGPRLSVPSGSSPNDKAHLLCFHRRNLSKPFVTCDGCFFNGSRRATLSWPATSEKPNVKRGDWLCEASITGGLPRAFYSYASAARPTGPGAGLPGEWPPGPLGGPVEFFYRQAYTFHQVADFDDPVFNEYGDSRFNQQITLVETANKHQWDDFEGRSWDSSTPPRPGSADERRADQFQTPNWPVTAANVADQGFRQWYPVILFDGLEHVFNAN
ncbi:MAG: hypothetical protein ACRDD1_01725, partial [Planctomycetia bacterium]